MRVDFHTHILPAIDDGSTSIAESLEMLRMEWKQGIRCVAATPHFYANRDNLDDFLIRRAQAAEELRQAMAECKEIPEILLGAEVQYFRGISDCEVLAKLALEGTRLVLIELPPAPWKDEIYCELDGIWRKQSLIPIIAHVDRYISPMRTYGIPKRLSELPVLVQANGEFFLRRRTVRFAEKLLRQGKIHVLGSDCHNLTDRKPNLVAVQEKICKHLGESALEKIRGRENIFLVSK